MSLNLSAWLRWVVSLTPWPLCPWGNGAHFPLNRRMHALWGWLDAFKNWKISCSCQELNRDCSVVPTCSLVTVDTAVLAALWMTFNTMLTIYIWRSRGKYPTPEHSSYISHSLIPFHHISCLSEYSMWAGDISLNVAERHIVLWWKNLLNVVDYLPIRRCYSCLADMRTE